MKTIFLGCTKFSERILRNLLEENLTIEAIFTIPEKFDISYSEKKVRNYNYSNIGKIAEDHKIPCYLVDSGENGKKMNDYHDIISEINPDVILVMGWYYMVPKKIRNLAKYGAWGIHASLLPKYAGGAPLVWAMINGEEEAGVSLFKLDSGVDDGDIIMQRKFPIDRNDTIKEVYEKATIASEEILAETFGDFENIKFTVQDKSKIEVYPQRSPEDGEIDLSWDAERIYNFIRAQAPPYPGAFIRTTDGNKIYIDKARLEK
ncbi:MAG: hypothetical protein SCALA702_33960 [Melioribacteraceae bacterium]|nr:MAG: hypothetical protein SCALA702_33960 [Melioribacteraceae bacterium]